MQDPSYSKKDHEYLRFLGLEPLNDPDGFERIDAGSLVFSPGTYYHMFFWIAQGIWPAAFVCEDHMNRKEPLGATYTCDDDGNPGPETSIYAPEDWRLAVDHMFRDCKTAPFPRDDEENWDRVLIHWRTVDSEKQTTTAQTENVVDV